MSQYGSVNEALLEMNNYHNKLTEYTLELKRRSGNKMLRELSMLRKLPIDIIDYSNIFYIEDATEMLLPRYLSDVESLGIISPTNKKPIFHNRWVIPIKNLNNQVINLVGYNNIADERYIYGTSKYYRRRDTLYGLENIKMAYDLGFAFLTEGITDTIRLRSLGHLNSFANCGTHNSDLILRQLNRCRYGVIKVPDRDSAGQRAVKKWKFNRSITLNPFIQYKDIDEMCRDSDENIDTVKEYLDICIDWIKSMEHRGLTNHDEIVTIQ